MRVALLAMCIAFPAAAQDLDDRHLSLAQDAAPAPTLLPGKGLGHDPAGTATVAYTGAEDAFSQPSAGLGVAAQEAFEKGNALFRKLWIAAPSDISGSDGLGPLYNARSCQACHLKDGRGHPPEDQGGDGTSIVLRLSVPGGTTPGGIADWIASSPDPTYGHQLQDLAAPSLDPEGRILVSYLETPVTLADGTVVSLRSPIWSLDAALGPPSPELALSPRIAPQMIGLGLLEAIPAAAILALADPEDRDGDGISGRVQIVPSVEFGVPMLGRFGLKAGAPTIREQTAAALAMDMGLSNPLFPDPWGDCTPMQSACRSAPHGQEADTRDGLEVDGQALELLTIYARNLGVPARRGEELPEVVQGQDIFLSLGCQACHQPGFTTHALLDQPEQSAQKIWPYTDLLLHDMGSGLADNRPEGRATGQEWRTPPLWGIGLTKIVSGHTQFLHDGRARTVLEAILWHGGEAQAQRDAVVALGAKDRAALLAFLNSL